MTTEESTRLREIGTEDKAIREFIQDWNSLPNIIKASVAATVATDLRRRIRHVVNNSVFDQDMPRRQRVEQQQILGLEILVTLLVQLTNIADDNVDAQGADTF